MLPSLGLVLKAFVDTSRCQGIINNHTAIVLHEAANSATVFGGKTIGAILYIASQTQSVQAEQMPKVPQVQSPVHPEKSKGGIICPLKTPCCFQLPLVRHLTICFFSNPAFLTYTAAVHPAHTAADVVPGPSPAALLALESAVRLRLLLLRPPSGFVRRVGV